MSTVQATEYRQYFTVSSAHHIAQIYEVKAESTKAAYHQSTGACSPVYGIKPPQTPG